MKIKFLILSCLVLTFFVAAKAYSAEGYYIGGNIGAGMLSDSDISAPNVVNGELSYDTGMVFGAVVGYDFNQFRVEGEIGYQENDVDNFSAGGVSLDGSGDVNGTVFLINGYYDFMTTSAFIPYITAGLGWANIEINDFNTPGSGVPDINDDDSVFAYQIGLGAGYEINPNFIVDLKYRYFGTDDPELADGEVEVGSHQIIFGLRYYF